MSKRDLLAGVIALSQEHPKRFLNLIRASWPEIKAAIDQGHTLKVIHERLRQAGVRMTYRCFTMHVRRLRREFPSPKRATELASPAAAGQDEGPSRPVPPRAFSEQSQPQALSDGDRDPYQSIREHLNRKPPGFDWDEDVPDGRKLYEQSETKGKGKKHE